MRFQRIAWTFSICLLLSLAARGQGLGQRQGTTPPPPPPPIREQIPSDADETQRRAAREMAKKANLQRQVLLKSDTERLVKLAGELKEYVDKSSENVLSLDVMKKAEEIEKLARSVKEKMKGPS